MSKYGKVRIIIGIVVAILGLNQLTLNHFSPTTEETIVAIIWIAAGIVFIVNLPEKLKRKQKSEKNLTRIDNIITDLEQETKKLKEKVEGLEKDKEKKE